MKKIIVFIISLIITAAWFGIEAGAEINFDAPFEEDSVIVVTKPVRKTYITTFSFDEPFGGLDIEEIKDLDHRQNNTISLFSIDGYVTGSKILKLTLAEKGRESVINAVNLLNSLSDIEIAEPNYIYTLDGDTYPDDTYYESNQNSLKIVHASEVWKMGIDCSDIVVGIIDSGMMMKHPDLNSNLWENPDETLNGLDDDGNDLVDDIHGWDFADNDNDPTDEYGHGTHVSGIVSAVTNNSKGIASIARNAKLAPLKVFYKYEDPETHLVSHKTNAGFVAEAMTYAISKGFDITNNSYGGIDTMADTILSIISSSDAKNTIFVCAAGNNSKNIDLTKVYPASWSQTQDNVISVAATNDTDKLATLSSGTSNYGKKSVDLAAPGYGILSTFFSVENGEQLPAYAQSNGTSMAAPLVSSTIAVMLKKFPNITPKEVKERLRASVDPIDSLQDITVSGGRLNAYEALLVHPEELNIGRTSIVFNAQSSATAYIAASVSPSDTTDEMIWASDNESVATVNNGTVTAVGDGTARITVTCGSLSGLCNVTVDRTAPRGTIEYSPADATSDSVTAKLIASEEIKPIEMTHIFTKNGSYTFEFEDLAGNKGTATATVDWIVKEPPVGTIEYSTSELTNEDVVATLTVDKEIKPIVMTHTFTKNGTYTFNFEDLDGYAGSATAAVDWIDKTIPTATVTYSPDTETDGSVTARITPSEPIRETELEHVFESNGEHTFSFTDLAGNKGYVTAIVNWITSVPTSPIPHEPSDRVEFNKQPDGKILSIVTFEVTTPPHEEETVLYIAYKDKDGALKRIEEKHTSNWNMEFTIPDGFEDCNISVYVWKKADMTPLMGVQNYIE